MVRIIYIFYFLASIFLKKILKKLYPIEFKINFLNPKIVHLEQSSFLLLALKNH